MRLPARENLYDPDHVFLYEHDVRELHNQNRTDFSRMMYVNRFQLMLEMVERFANGKFVLDVGCAQGNFSLALAERGYRVVAMDLKRSFLQYLLLKYERGHVTCLLASLEHFPFIAGSFDVILLGEILEHVAYPEKLLGQAASLLKIGGVVIATTPNGERWHTGLPIFSAIKDREIILSRQFQPDAEGHLFLLTKQELLRMAQDAGLQVEAHRFFGTPWVTGRLLFRHLGRLLPIEVRLLLDRATLRLPRLARFLSEAQVLVALRNQSRTLLRSNAVQGM